MQMDNLGDIDEARENADNAYLDEQDRAWNEELPKLEQKKADDIQDITFSISDTLDDMLYEIKHHDKKSLSNELTKLANMDMTYTDDDTEIPDDVFLNDDFCDLIDALGDPVDDKDFKHSVKVLKQYKHIADKEFKKNEEIDSSLFLEID